jgi:cation transport regulator ChaB
MPVTKKGDLPGTIQRSDQHAQHIYAKTHDSAVETYGEGERAHRTALAALKHSYKKEGDRWVAKDKKGPSDPQAARGANSKPSAVTRARKTAGGREVPLDEWPKQDLYLRAQQLDVKGRSSMSKGELVKAVKKAS